MGPDGWTGQLDFKKLTSHSVSQKDFMLFIYHADIDR